MIYISPTGSFNNPRTDLTANDAGVLAKVQIENSLALGWKPKDILLVTNFDYHYRSIKAKVLKDIEFFNRKPQVSKINAIISLFDHNLIKKGELYWFHDLDAFQLEPIAEPEIKIKNNEIGLTDFAGSKPYAGQERWSGGCFFFKHGSGDIFKKTRAICYKQELDEEKALVLLAKKNSKIKRRLKKVNNTYNFIGFNFRHAYKITTKPIKVVHFHPYGEIKKLNVERPLDFFLGQNPLKKQLITDTLRKILKYHRIT